MAWQQSRCVWARRTYMAEVCEDDQPPRTPKRILLLGSSSMYSSMECLLKTLSHRRRWSNETYQARDRTFSARCVQWIEVSTELSKSIMPTLLSQFIEMIAKSNHSRQTSQSRASGSHWNNAYYKGSRFCWRPPRTGAFVLIGMPIVRSCRSLLNANQIKSVAETVHISFLLGKNYQFFGTLHRSPNFRIKPSSWDMTMGFICPTRCSVLSKVSGQNSLKSIHGEKIRMLL